MARPQKRSLTSILIALSPSTRRPPDPAQREKTLNSILVAVSAAGVALVLLREVNYGVGLGSDSRHYVATARSLLEGNWFTTWNGEPIAKIAPFFPAVLAFFGLFGLKVITVGAFLNAIAFGTIIFTTTVWLKVYVKSRFLVVWAGCVIALWVPLADLSAIIMTDTLFISLLLLSLYTLDRYLATMYQSMLIISAVCASLTWLTRYQGFALVAAALLLILVQQGFALTEKVKYAAIYATIAGTPMAGWIIRNLIVTNTVAGSREGLLYQDPLILDSITSELVYWTLGNTGSRYANALYEAFFAVTETGMSIPEIIYRTVILLAVAVGIGYAFIYLRRKSCWENSMAVAVPATFILVYVVISTILPLTQYETITIRYLLVLYVPVLVVIVIILDKLLVQISAPRYMPAVSTVILSLWLIQSIPDNYANINNRIENGFDAASKTWAKSDTIRYLKSNPLNGTVYSTSAWVMYFSDVCTDNCTLIPIQHLWNQDGRFIGPVSADGPVHIVVLQQENYYNFLMELAELTTLEINSIHLDGVIMKPADSVNAKNDVLTQDMIIDMVLLNPDRLDGRSVLERYPLES